MATPNFIPKDSLVADMISQLDDNLLEDFEERAGIMEYDAMLPRAHAECLALLDVLRRHPTALLNVTVMEAEFEGETQWLLTTDPIHTRQRLMELGAVVVDVLDLAEVIVEQYSGLAALSTMF